MNQNFNPQAEFDKELKAKLTATPFQFEKENQRHILDYAVAMLENVSIGLLDCDTETHTSVCAKASEKRTDWNLYEVAYLLNGFRSVTAKQLDLPLPVYTMVLFYADDSMKTWNDLVDPIKSEIGKKIQNRIMLQQNLGAKATNRLVDPNLRAN